MTVEIERFRCLAGDDLYPRVRREWVGQIDETVVDFGRERRVGEPWRNVARNR